MREQKPRKQPDEEQIKNIRAVYTNLADAYHSSLTLDVLDYLNKRGLKKDTIEKYQLGFCSADHYSEYDDEAVRSAGILINDFPILTNRITIPYLVGNTVTDIRGRIVEPLYNYRKNTPKYISLAGSYQLRGANYLFNHEVIDTSDTIILTEGEFKALVAIQYGFPVVATPGISRWDDSWTELLKNKEVILAADNEKTIGRRPPAYFQAKLLAKKLPKLRVAILQRDSKKKKVDIDSLITEHGVGLFEFAIKSAIDVNTYLKMEERKSYGR